MLSYASDLTSKTGARGSYSMEFSHYDEVPGHLADKVIANAKAGTTGEEEEEQAKPEKLSGLGQESFWLASRVGGALFVLKKNTIFRISVGGAGDVKTKLSKSRTLATKALARL